PPYYNLRELLYTFFNGFLLIILQSFHHYNSSSLLHINFSCRECKAESGDPLCHNNKEAQKLKLIATPIDLSGEHDRCFLTVVHSLGSCFRTRPKSVSVYPQVLFWLPVICTFYQTRSNFNNLTSKCLPEDPWRKFPFSCFIAMVSALSTLMVDSFSMSAYKKRAIKRDPRVQQVNPIKDRFN
ncbi:unnamed protein product, partial [Thlaspi arvense]